MVEERQVVEDEINRAQGSFSGNDGAATFEEVEAFQIQDILDLTHIQEINQAFAYAIGMASTLVDLQGIPITPPCNHSHTCRLIRSTPKGLSNCRRSGRILGQKAHELKHPFARPCYGIGFVDAAAPIIVKGRHIATWLVGQANLGDVDEARVIAYARTIGADETEMLTAYRSMTNMPMEEFQVKLDFFWRLSQQISTLGYRNLKYSRVISELRASQDELKRYKLYLENTVEERTRELKNTLQKLEHLSNTDYLTGCFNRQYLQQNLDKEIKRSRRYDRSLSILLCDIDHFKRVNDRHGHQCGDQVLVDFTTIIRSLIRENIDWLARYGGEEFLLVLPETDAEAAHAMAERLRCKVAGTPLEWRGAPITLTASFGAATFQPRGSEPAITSDRLIQIADQNLYRAKTGGRNRVVCGG